MAQQLLMPKATAVWLVDNTALTFSQIAKFCGMHLLEVEGIADGEVAQGIIGQDPISAGQLTREELKRCEADQEADLQIAPPQHEVPVLERRRGPRYTPVSRRRDRPDAIAWLVRNHEELTDSQIGRLVGTTKPTITAVRERTHWNAASIRPVDPVTLGLCSQGDLDKAVQKAAGRKGAAKSPTDPTEPAAPAATLEPFAESGQKSETPPKTEKSLEEIFAQTPSAEPRQGRKQRRADHAEAESESESAFAKLAELRKDMEQDKNAQ